MKEHSRRVVKAEVADLPLGGLVDSWHVAEEDVPPRSEFNPQKLRQLVLLLTLKGEARTSDEIGTVQCRPNSILLMPFGSIIREKVSPSRRWHIRYLLFSGLIAAKFHESFWRGQQARIHLFANPPSQWRTLLSEIIAQTFEQSSNWNWKVLSLIGTLLDLMLTISPTEAVRKSISERAKQIVEGDASKTWSVAELAAEMQMSTSLLAHEFKNQSGESPGQWMREHRIKVAEGLLKQGLSVSTVSESLGFSNPYHFSRAFYAVKGLRPSAFSSAASSPLHS